MSHLIIEQGKNAGKEITVPEDGLKFGRSPVNDIVLKSSKVMLFHGRFFFKSDGTLWVTDFGAAEKTTVGGQPVDEEQLKVGDLVEVGDTAFRVLEASLDGDVVSPAPVSEAMPSGEIDLGFKKTTPPTPDFSRSLPQKPSSGSRLVQIALVLVVLIIVGAVGLSLKNMSDKSISSVAAVQEELLILAYERVIGDSQNIFRYYLELDSHGTFSVKIDDLRHHRHTSKKEKLDEGKVDRLSRSILDAGFFDTEDGDVGEVLGKYDLVDMAIFRNGIFHHVRNLNRSRSLKLEKTIEILEEFAKNELDIPIGWELSADELMKLANDAFMLAEIRYAERNVRYENLATAIKHYEEARLYMETIEPKPALFQQATDGLKRAKEEQSSRYDDFSFRADRAIRLKNWPDAAKHLRIVLELVPDRSDERHEKANIKLLRVEQNLK